MRVLILTFGTRGDVQPYVALAIGLIKAGHQVFICTHATYRPFIEEFGVQFVNYPGSNPQKMFDWCVQHGIFSIKFMREITALGWDFMSGWDTVVREAVGKYDLIISTFTCCYMGVTIAEASKVPVCIAHYLPIGETSYYFSPFAPRFMQVSTSSPSVINRVSHEIIEYLYGQLGRYHTNITRANVGLPPIDGFHRWSNWTAKTNAPLLYAYSPSFLPKPPDYPDRARVVGYWWLPDAPDYEPFPELKAFLEAGEPPVYVGFGSVTVPGDASGDHGVVPRLIQAIQLAKKRALVFTSEKFDQKYHNKDTLFVNAAVPHSWLFPRMALIIHHGGAGTVAYALKAGVPSIIVPFFGDHHLWGSRLVDAGCGPNPILPSKLVPAKVAKVIIDTIDNPSYKKRLTLMKDRVSKEDGVAESVRYLEHLQRTGSFPPLTPKSPTPFCPYPIPLTPYSPMQAVLPLKSKLRPVFRKVYAALLVSVQFVYDIKVQGVANWLGRVATLAAAAILAYLPTTKRVA